MPVKVKNVVVFERRMSRSFSRRLSHPLTNAVGSWPYHRRCNIAGLGSLQRCHQCTLGLTGHPMLCFMPSPCIRRAAFFLPRSLPRTHVSILRGVNFTLWSLFTASITDDIFCITHYANAISRQTSDKLIQLSQPSLTLWAVFYFGAV